MLYITNTQIYVIIMYTLTFLYMLMLRQWWFFNRPTGKFFVGLAVKHAYTQFENLFQN